jgi:hypothetical protein
MAVLAEGCRSRSRSCLYRKGGSGWRSRLAAFAACCLVFSPVGALGYSAAGDRTFPASIFLPQLAPADEFYLPTAPRPDPGNIGRATGVFEKTITENLSAGIKRGYSWQGDSEGWRNIEVWLKYGAVLDPASEFVFSGGLMREFGDTGARRAGASPVGATTPRVYFGKGFGDLDLGYLRPLAIVGSAGYMFSDGGRRPDTLAAGFAVQYSIPYLQSKVRSFNLPDAIRRMTPLVEVTFAPPIGRSFGQRTVAIIAPGVSYTGEGWELALEAWMPITRATGRGVGVAAQLYLSLEYLFPTTIGKPLFSAR